MPNLPHIIEIGYSWKRLLVLLAGGIILTAGSATMAFHLFPDMRVDAFYTAVGYFGVIFFGFAILKIGWLLVTARGPVLFVDRRCASLSQSAQGRFRKSGNVRFCVALGGQADID